MLFSEPKIPQSWKNIEVEVDTRVSVLFSEPKIPQYVVSYLVPLNEAGFSALQRAENSSIDDGVIALALAVCFSALQRAENSSISLSERANKDGVQFQCSSASRKFLN